MFINEYKCFGYMYMLNNIDYTRQLLEYMHYKNAYIIDKLSVRELYIRDNHVSVKVKDSIRITTN